MKLRDNFGVIMLNKFALKITLNWLCNTAVIGNVHGNILFFVLDREAEEGLQKEYPNLHTFRWEIPCLKDTFRFGDEKYMSFFLLRTNLIRALLKLKRSFWMLQADTFWRANLFAELEKLPNKVDILLDQQGYDGLSEERKKVMNGANFYVPYSNRTAELVESWYWYQSHFCVTDPDAIKIMCNAENDYSCAFINYRLISGWEWIYGDQQNPPMLIQLDGETGGGKIEALRKYGFWFLKRSTDICDPKSVHSAIHAVENQQVPKLFSSSKLKQKLLLFAGEVLAQIPLFGTWYQIYGGIPSLYMQFL